jgi:integrase
MARNGDGLFLRNGYCAFKYRDGAGNWREKSTGKKSLSQALLVKTQFLKQLEDGTLPEDMATWTLKQAADHWYELRSVTKPGKTAETERRFLKQIIAVLGEGRILQSLKPHDLEFYQVKRLKGNGTRKAVKARTVNYELFCLQQLLKRAGLWSRFREHYRPLRVPKTGPGTVIDVATARRLFSVATTKSLWMVAFCASLLAYCTGMRAGEIRALVLGDIHLNDPSPFIRLRAEATKSRRERDVPLNSGAQWALRRLLERAATLNCTRPEHFLLPLNRSKHTRPEDVRRGDRGYDPTAHQSSWSSAWTSLRKKAGVPRFRFHDLRHSFITAAAEADVPVSVIQSIVGHLSPEMTLRYTHIQSQAQRQAAKAVEDATRSAFSSLLLIADDHGSKIVQ